MSGSTVGGIVGAGIGFLVGGPAGLRWGFMIGSMLGGIVDPAHTEGPRLKDTQRQTAQEGSPIPFGYGTFPVPTQLLWQSDVTEHEHEEGGKGGPTSTTYTYTRSYAIGLCEGPITGVLKLWRNDKLVYDATPGSTIAAESSKTMSKVTIYLGDETQNVDPTIEAFEGVGETGPMRGLAYFVVEDDDTNAGEVAQWRAVVQKCGTATVNQAKNFLSVGGTSKVQTSATGAAWTDQTGGLTGVTLRDPIAVADTAVAVDGSGEIWRSTDRGATWAATGYTYSGLGEGVYLHGIMGYWRTVAGVVSTVISVDGGLTWGAGGTVGTTTANAWAASNAVAVLATGNTNGGLYSTADLVNFDLRESGDFTAVGWNREGFLAGPNTGTGFKWSASGLSWSAAAGTMADTPRIIVGAPGYFVVGAGNIYTTYTNGGAFTTEVTGGGPYWSGAAFGEYVVIGSGAGGGGDQQYSTNSGATFTQISPALGDNGIAFLGPDYDWEEVPDSPGTWVDPDGGVHVYYLSTTELSTCGSTTGAIIADLCDRVGIESSEIDVTDMTDFVRGYPCATEGSAAAFIEPLTQAFFFDRGEWDKKLRFVPRGGASAFALTHDDLVWVEGPAFKQTRVQEVELLRKVSIITCDPDAEFTAKPQSWERRSGTINAKGEASFEVPIVCSADVAKQIAHKKVNVAWSELDKCRFGLSLKWSKLTPTDVGTYTDRDGVVHRIRLTTQNEDANVFMVEEAMRDRAEAYDSSAVGTPTTSTGGSTPGLIGPTVFTAMNLPQLRPQDGQGMYVGAAGKLPGWKGAAIMLSVDGGTSYTTVLTITRPTKLGPLTDACTSSDEPIQAHVYGGTLASATTAQVTAGANYAAVVSGGTAEVLAYEDATATASGYYDLETVTRGLLGTTAAAHAEDDMLMDLATCYFVPIDAAYAGTVYFKAVALGVSADAVTGVAYTYSPAEIIIDGGEIT